VLIKPENPLVVSLGKALNKMPSRE